MHVFYMSWKLWEVHLYVFYLSGRLSGGGGGVNLNELNPDTVNAANEGATQNPNFAVGKSASNPDGNFINPGKK